MAINGISTSTVYHNFNAKEIINNRRNFQLQVAGKLVFYADASNSHIIKARNQAVWFTAQVFNV